jgi:hypothetical protein
MVAIDQDERCANCGQLYKDHQVFGKARCRGGQTTWFPKSVADALDAQARGGGAGGGNGSDAA